MSLWVLGTDTSVGKTVVSALILHRHATRSRLAYWKPISTGGDDDRDRRTIEGWAPAAVDILEETYIFDPPVSPHLAARWADVSIDPDVVLGDLVRHALENEERNLIIEAAGGVLVPVNDHGVFNIDLVRESALPAVVVARSTLGTINHTLLTLRALRESDIEVAGVVLNGPPNIDNREAIERFGKVAIIGEVPLLPVEPGSTPRRRDIEDAAGLFDPENRLARYLDISGPAS